MAREATILAPRAHARYTMAIKGEQL